jgi:hypothetical protein
MGWGFVPNMARTAHAAALQHTSAAVEAVSVIPLATRSEPALGQFLGELFNSELLSDITLCAEDGRAFRCHKLVLSRWSPPLRRMLCGGAQHVLCAAGVCAAPVPCRQLSLWGSTQPPTHLPEC